MPSFDIDAKLRSAIANNQELFIHYNSVFDGRAGDLKYHQYCIKTFMYSTRNEEVKNSIGIQTQGFFESREIFE